MCICYKCSLTLTDRRYKLLTAVYVVRVLAEQLQQGVELSSGEQVVLERWLDEAKFSRVLKPSTYREAIQRVLCHYVFDSRMSQLQAIAVSPVVNSSS